MKTVDEIAKVTIFSFGSAIVEYPTEITKLSLLWEFENSWSKSDGYYYKKPRKIIEKNGTFYHLFYKEGLHPLDENDINKRSDYRGDASVFLFPEIKFGKIKKGIYEEMS